MLTIFLVIFGVIGLFLNWPILNEGIFKLFTTPLNIDIVALSFKQYSTGIVRIDGIVVAVSAFIILVTAFLHTTKVIINLRIFLLALNSAVLSAEIFSVIKFDFPFYSYPGLLYSLVFLLLAFTAAVFRIGSLKSFKSTFIGKPVSESQVFSRTIGNLIGNITVTRGVRIRAVDNIQPEFKKGEAEEYEAGEIRIGRDKEWANLVIGDEWEAVSGKHGILRAIGETLFFEPLTDHYAFAINGTPHKKSTEVQNNAEISLVSGYGPKIKIEGYAKNHSLIHPRTMVRAGEIARDEFKKLQGTFKILLIMAFLALPLLWFLLGVQKSGWADHLNAINTKNEELNRQLQEQADRMQESEDKTGTQQSEISKLKRAIRQLQKEGKTKEKQLQAALKQYHKMEGDDSGHSTISGLENFAKVVDIKFCTQRIGILFPYITLFKNGRITVGSAFFAKGTKGEPYILTEKAGVYQRKNSGVTYLFLYTRTWDAFANFYQKIKAGNYREKNIKKELDTFLKINNVLEIPGKRWKSLRPASTDRIAAVSAAGFPEYLRDDIPVIDSRVSIFDRTIFLGFREGRKHYSSGPVTNIAGNFIHTGSGTAHRDNSGLLLKVLKDGRYSVVGILESAGSKSKTRQEFLKF
ncbi:MAG: flagellar FliJ family protein [Candidatus Aminicenantes bacterium]|nr:flagellar FliJ family protein [Candidatus Aminicenantes bacterium]